MKGAPHRYRLLVHLTDNTGLKSHEAIRSDIQEALDYWQREHMQDNYSNIKVMKET